MPRLRNSQASRALDISSLSQSSELPLGSLPTNGDLIRYSRLLKENISNGSSHAQVPKQVAQALILSWTNVSPKFVPPLTHDLKYTVDQVKKLLKLASNPRDANTATIKKLYECQDVMFEFTKCRLVSVSALLDCVVIMLPCSQC